MVHAPRRRLGLTSSDTTLTGSAVEARQSVPPAARTPGSPRQRVGGLRRESKNQPLPWKALLIVLLAQSCSSLLRISSPSVKSWAGTNCSVLPTMAMVLVFISLFLSFFSH